MSEFDKEFLNEDHRKVNKIKNGNYINVICKSNFNVINKIKYDNLILPRTINLSNVGNIYTIAHILYLTNIFQKKIFHSK